MNRILGIDPGSHNLGIAFMQRTGQKLQLLSAKTLVAPKKEKLYTRLTVLVEELIFELDQWQPHEIAVEDLFVAHNPRSAFALGMARGVAIGACLQRKLPIFEYAPSQVKSVVTGYGHADKAQVKKMVELTLGKKLELGFDATDAIAIAICHAHSVKFIT